MVSLVAEELRLRYAGARKDADDIVKGVSLEVPAGQITVLIGPNGCGKSTLFSGLSRLLAPSGGNVRLDGQIISDMPTRDVAKRVALLPQNPLAPEGMSVLDLVRQGRTPHQGILGRGGPDDDAAVTRAMEATGITELAHRPVEALSGGQRQRVWLAMALAQETEILLLDEPTSFLDIGHAIGLLSVVRDLNRERGITVVMVLHDLFLAARFADYLVAMNAGQIVAQGAPQEVLGAELAEQLYGVPCAIVADPTTGRPVVLPQ